MNCEQCVYWTTDNLSERQGDCECRRFPPIPLVVMTMAPLATQPQMNIAYYFPRTRKDIECGEFRAKLKMV